MVKINKKYPNAILVECENGKKIYNNNGNLIECDINNNIILELGEPSKLEKKLLNDFKEILEELKNLKEDGNS